MNISFNREPDDTLSALSFDVVWKGYYVEELYWADVSKALGSYMVRWNDDYSNPLHFDSEELAKQYVVENYSRHNPHINGKQYELRRN